MNDKNLISIINNLTSMLEKTKKDLENANNIIAFQQEIMKSAAEEIHEHWIHHCDENGFGPISLVSYLTGKRKYANSNNTFTEK